MRFSHFQSQVLLSPTRGMRALHSKQQQLHTGAQGCFPLHPATLHRFPSRIWRPLETHRTSPPARLLAKEKGQRGKARTGAPPEKLTEDSARATLRQPAPLGTRPSFVQTRHRWPMHQTFFWGNLSSSKRSVRSWNEFSWLSHLEGVLLQGRSGEQGQSHMSWGWK